MRDTPFKTTFESIEAIDSYIGKDIGISEWVQIDQECISQFGKLTKDEQWIHCDRDRSAESSPFEDTIAHGFLLLSFCSHFLEECVEMKNIKMGINYGFNKVRFSNPVKVNSRIRGRFKLLSVRSKTESVKLKYAVTIEIEGDEKPAVIAEWIGLVIL